MYLKSVEKRPKRNPYSANSK